jgi:hypothetical protein
MQPTVGPTDTGKTTGKRPQRRGLVAATAAVALLAAACGTSDDEQTADAGSGEQAAQDGPQFDATVFSGEALTVSGDAFDLGSLADKDLVLWFWAPW